MVHNPMQRWQRKVLGQVQHLYGPSRRETFGPHRLRLRRRPQKHLRWIRQCSESLWRPRPKKRDEEESLFRHYHRCRETPDNKVVLRRNELSAKPVSKDLREAETLEWIVVSKNHDPVR